MLTSRAGRIIRATGNGSDRKGKSSPMKFDESLGYLIFRTHKALKKGFMAIIDEYGLTERQFAVLRRLHEREGQSAVELVSHLFSDSSTLAAVIDRLEQKGMVRREDDPSDRRVNRLFLTDKAGDFMPRLMERMTGLENERRRAFSRQEVRALKSALLKLYRLGMAKEQIRDRR